MCHIQHSWAWESLGFNPQLSLILKNNCLVDIDILDAFVMSSFNPKVHFFDYLVWLDTQSVTLIPTVMIVYFQLCSVMILTRSWQTLRKTQASYTFSSIFVVLSSPIEHNLFGIQACLATHTSCAYLFNHLRLNPTCLYTRPSHLTWPCLYLVPRSLTCDVISHHVISISNQHGSHVLKPSQVLRCHQSSQLPRSCPSEYLEHPLIWVLSRQLNLRCPCHIIYRLRTR